MLEEFLQQPSSSIEALEESLREEIRSARILLGAILRKMGGEIVLEASLLASVSSQSMVLSKEDIPGVGLKIRVTEARR